MATVTFGNSTPSTANTDTYAATSLTPAAGDLLVVFAHYGASVEPGATFACTDNQAGTYTKIVVKQRSGGASSLVLFVRDQLVSSAVGHILTVTNVGDNATGENTHIYRVAGMSRAGASAVRQSAVFNDVAGSTPTPTFALTTLTANPILGAVGSLSTAPAVVEPSGWTEGSDDAYATPDTTTESAFINSGFVGTTVTWGGVSAGSHGDIVVELDTGLVDANYQWRSPTSSPGPRFRSPRMGPRILLRQRFDVPVATGTTTPQSVDATTTLTSALAAQANKLLAVTVTLTAALARQTAKTAAVTVTHTAALLRTTAKTAAVTVTHTVGLLRNTGKIIAAAATFTAALVASLVKAVAIAVTVTLTAVLSRMTGKLAAITVTLTAALARSVGKLLAVTVTHTVALLRNTGKIIAATVTLTAALVTSLVKSVAIAVTVTLTAALARAVGKLVAITATLTAALARVVGKLASVTVTHTVALLRTTAKAVDVVVTLTAALTRIIAKTVAAAVTLTADLVKQTAKTVVAVATLAADVTKRVSKTIAAGITATVGLVAEKIAGGGTTFYQTIAAAVRFIIRTPLD